MKKQFKACKDVDFVSAGDSFEWLNTSNKDCTLTKCQPPLTQSSYFVAKNGGTAAATVDAKATPGTYPYKCDCEGIENQPVIIIK